MGTIELTSILISISINININLVFQILKNLKKPDNRKKLTRWIFRDVCVRVHVSMFISV